MKKYFIKDTKEELEFGDMIELTLTKDTPEGTITHEVECRFTEESIPYLLDLDVIETDEEEVNAKIAYIS